MSNTNNNTSCPQEQRLTLEVAALAQRDQQNSATVKTPDGDTAENARDVDEEAEIVSESTCEGHLRAVVMVEHEDGGPGPAPGQPGNQYTRGMEGGADA